MREWLVAVSKSSAFPGAIFISPVAALIAKRPASGIGAQYIYDLVGKVAAKDMQEDHIIEWGDLSEAADRS